jgi:predicted nucleic acid-binding protein
MIYLLDTNVWVQFLRNRHALVVRRIHAHQPFDLRVCAVTAAELFYGCLRSAKPRANRATVEAVLAPYFCLPFERPRVNVPIFGGILRRSAHPSDLMTYKLRPSPAQRNARW